MQQDSTDSPVLKRTRGEGRNGASEFLCGHGHPNLSTRAPCNWSYWMLLPFSSEEILNEKYLKSRKSWHCRCLRAQEHLYFLFRVCVCLCVCAHAHTLFSEIPSETGLSPEWHFAVLIKSLSLVMPASRKPRAPFLFVRGHTVVYIKKILGYLKNTLMFWKEMGFFLPVIS